MKNIYYTIWADAIHSTKKQNLQNNDWKFSLFVLMTTINSLNLWVLQVWLKYFGILDLNIKIDIFQGSILNNFSIFVLQFASPFIILNYFLIFYKRRYFKLLEKYQSHKGRFAGIYIIVSALIAFLSALIYSVLS